MNDTVSRDEVLSVMERIAEHIISFQNPDGGWGKLESSPSDPWATAEVIYVLSRLPSGCVRSWAELENAVSDGIDYLLDQQANDGSFTSAEYGNSANVTTTAYALMALNSVDDRFRFDGGIPDAIKSTYDWILDKQLESGGWVDEERNISLEARNGEVYATAYVLKALSALRRRSLRSARINSGTTWLVNARNQGEGWGPNPNTAPDPTYTTYCLDGLLDADHLYGIEIEERVFRESIAWLLANQHPEGSWSDWQGITHSVEATAHSVRILIRVGTGRESKPVQLGVRWILDNVRENGWFQDPNSDTTVSVWATVDAIEALLYYIGEGHKVDETTDKKQLRYHPWVLSLTTLPSQRRWKQVAFWGGLIATILASFFTLLAIFI